MKSPIAFVVVAALAVSWPAWAAVTISSATTQNMSCSGGVCVPTASDAVLNVGDLEAMLVSGNVKVATTGSGVQGNNIEIDAGLTWSGATTLALDAYQTILIKAPVSVTGQGGFSVTTNDGGKDGYFGFRNKGQVTFANLSSPLVINGATYTLVGDISTLAADIGTNSAGNFAFAHDYDAANDGTYSNSPIPTQFSGAFEGLGNTISRLSLKGTGDANSPVGLFAELASDNEPGGSIENINLHKLSVGGSGLFVGGLVGLNEGAISGAFVDGSLTATFEHGAPSIGSIVGVQDVGIIARSSAIAAITSDEAEGDTGGLAGESAGTILQSFAQCKISTGDTTYPGGIVGQNLGPIIESYAGGLIMAGNDSEVGGLVGDNAEESTIAQSYSTVALKGGGHEDHDIGGLIGVDDSPVGSDTSDYWDTTTSRIKNWRKGAGTPRKDPGITGLTTEQLQSGLPKGFDPKVWAENPKINNGLPYLIDNPPRE